VGGVAFSALILLPFLLAADPAGGPSTVDLSRGADRLSFEPNLGQVAPEVGFLARGSGYRMFVRPDGLVFDLSEGAAADAGGLVRLGMVFANADSGVRTEPLERLSGKVHYLVGDDPDHWLTGIPTFGAVIYRQLYPGVDLVLRGERRQLELEFSVAAGADPERVLIDLEGADDIELNASGGLLLRFGETAWQLERPVFVPAREGQDVAPAEFVRLEDGVGFALEGLDAEEPFRVRTFLVRSDSGSADPGSSWGEMNGAVHVATDDSGATWVVGRVRVEAERAEAQRFAVRDESRKGPRTGRRGERRGDPRPSRGETNPVEQGESFVIRLDPEGSTVLHTTYIGGRGRDVPLDIALGSDGLPVIVGSTSSRGFPTVNAAQERAGGGSDAFALKLSADGSGFVYSTLIGGVGDDSGHGVFVDTAGRAWLTGLTSSDDFPTTPGALQPAPGGNGDAFVTLLAADGLTLEYSTYLGGRGNDEAHGVALDSEGGVHLTGTTWSSDFPLVNPLQPEHGGAADAFVAKLNPGGTELVYSTYFGGAGEDEATGLAVDATGQAHVVGTTSSSDIPLLQAYQPALTGPGDAFVAKLAARGSSLLYATYLGGSADERGCDVALDAGGGIWVTGITDSPDFPSDARGSSEARGSTDAFLAGLSPDGSRLIRSTHLGGAGADAASAVALHPDGDVIVAGTTRSTDLRDATMLESSADGGASFLTRTASSIRAIGCPGTRSFDGDVSLEWNLDANWSDDTLPVAGDDACIDGFAVTLSGGTHTVSSLKVQNGGTLTISGGTLNVDVEAQFDAALTQTGGTLGGDGDVTVTGLFTWDGGDQRGFGTTTASGGLDMGSTAIKALRREMNNAAMAIWSDGQIQIIEGGTGPGVFNNLGTGIFDNQFDGSMFWQGGAPVFNNMGTFRKSAGAGTTAISTIDFNNSGTVDVLAGTLSLNGGGTSTAGSFDSTGATLRFAGETHDLDAATTITGTNLTMNGGTLNHAGSLNVTGVTTFGAGTANFTGSITSIGALAITGGIGNISNTEGSVTVPTMTQSAGALDGSSDVTVTGLFTWDGGDQRGFGVTNANGGIAMGTTGTKVLHREMNNAATAAWSDGQFQIIEGGFGPGVFNNLGTGTFDNQFDGLMFWQGGIPVFNNMGMFRKSAGTGTTVISSIVFNNDGMVDVQTGTLSANSGGTSGGSFDSTGTTMQFSGGTHDLQATSSVTGNVLVSGGTVNVSGSYTATGTTASGGAINYENTTTAATTVTLDQTGGTVGGAGDLDISGLFTWDSGSHQGFGITNANGNIAMGTPGAKVLRRELNNAATATWSNGQIQIIEGGFGPGVFNNLGTGTFDAQFDGSMIWQGGTPVFNNMGTFLKSAGTGTTQVGSQQHQLRRCADRNAVRGWRGHPHRFVRLDGGDDAVRRRHARPAGREWRDR
jgi:hypothetical protein